MSLKKVSDKDDLRSHILRKHSFGVKSRALIIFDINDNEIRDFFLEVAKSLDIALIPATWSQEEKWEYAGYDACISDEKSWYLDIVALAKESVVPILPRENSFSGIFSEFDPMKFTGNAFLFAETNKYLIFEKLVRYLENIRYAWDKRTLLTNVMKTF